jgi:DNA-binding transcriptional regulator WhiA
MRSFKEFLLLREMPYYENEDGDIYDLEMELYKEDLEGFRQKLLDILKGNKQTDKRGNTLILKSEEDIKTFLNWLSTNNQVLMFLKMRHQVNPIEFIDNIVHEI